MKVGTLAKRVDEHRVLRHVREHAKLDLRVVGRNQHVIGIGDERAADLAAERRLDRNVLEIRIAAAQSPGCGARLIQACVHAARVGVHQLRQRVDVGALQLGQLAIFQDRLRELVLEGKLFEDAHVRRKPGLGALPRVQLQLLEQDLL